MHNRLKWICFILFLMGGYFVYRSVQRKNSLFCINHTQEKIILEIQGLHFVLQPNEKISLASSIFAKGDSTLVGLRTKDTTSKHLVWHLPQPKRIDIVEYGPQNIDMKVVYGL